MENRTPVLSAGARLWMEYLKAKARRDAGKLESQVGTSEKRAA